MSNGPKLICLVSADDGNGQHWYWAGTPDPVEAEKMAIDRGLEEGKFTVKAGPNKFGVKHGEWQQAAP